MTDKSGTHYHKYATRSEHNTSPPHCFLLPITHRRNRATP